MKLYLILVLSLLIFILPTQGHEYKIVTLRLTDCDAPDTCKYTTLEKVKLLKESYQKPKKGLEFTFPSNISQDKLKEFRRYFEYSNKEHTKAIFPFVFINTIRPFQNGAGLFKQEQLSFRLSTPQKMGLDELTIFFPIGHGKSSREKIYNSIKDIPRQYSEKIEIVLQEFESYMRKEKKNQKLIELLDTSREKLIDTYQKKAEFFNKNKKKMQNIRLLFEERNRISTYLLYSEKNYYHEEFKANKAKESNELNPEFCKFILELKEFGSSERKKRINSKINEFIKVAKEGNYIKSLCKYAPDFWYEKIKYYFDENDFDSLLKFMTNERGYPEIVLDS